MTPEEYMESFWETLFPSAEEAKGYLTSLFLQAQREAVEKTLSIVKMYWHLAGSRMDAGAFFPENLNALTPEKILGGEE